MSNLIDEAIADAKDLRKMAEEVAKEQLTEKFMPQIKNLLAEKLKEASGMSDEDEEDENKDEKDKMDEQSSSSQIGKGDNKVKQASGKDEEDPGKGKLTEAEDCEDDEELDEDLDMTALMKELDEAVAEVEDKLTEAKDEKEDEDMEDEKEDEEDEDMKESDSMTFARKHLEEYVDSILKNFQSKLSEKKAPIKEDSHKVKELRTELNESKKTIQFLTEKIKEVVLINNKLVYAGKIFKNYNLDQEAKTAILESFDEAKTSREVKILFEGIERTLKGSRAKAKSINVGGASKQVQTTKPSQEKILESNSMVNRMKELAGIL